MLDLASRRQLFVDRHLIDRMEGLRLKLAEPRPANTILTIERPWEGPHNFGAGIYFHEGRYRLYYRAMPGETFGKHYCAVVFSDDGIVWTRPALGLVEVLGTTENNVIALEDENGQLQPARGSLDFWLDENPAAPDEQRFKLVTYETNGGQHDPSPASGKGALHRAIFWASRDGLRFRKMDPQPDFTSTLQNSFDGVARYFWSAAEQQYVCYFRCYDQVRTIARATSRDLLTWTEPVWMTYGETPRENLYENMTTPYFRGPHLYVALATRFMEGRTGIMTHEQFRSLRLADFYKQRADAFNGHPADGVFMTTRPGATAYDRTFMESFVRPGIGLENWVGRGNYLLGGVIQTGPAEMSIYVMRHYQQPSWHLQRMTLRVDGFASLHAPYEGGEMISKPFTFEGNQLTINYATSVAGGLRFELQDEQGRALPGFALADADEIVGDEIERVVSWGGRTDLSALAGKPIRVRVAMRDADLYALRFR